MRWIGEAKDDLLRRRVYPRSCNSFIDNDISVVLAIIEHVDPGKYLSGKYPPEKLINETLVILGTNKENAYRYSRSKAGAMGLFQFIPGTYKRIQNLYPGAGLNKDFVKGMEDHQNAAKASFLLFDADMYVLTDSRRQRLLEDPAALARFLAPPTTAAPAERGEAWKDTGTTGHPPSPRRPRYTCINSTPPLRGTGPRLCFTGKAKPFQVSGFTRTGGRNSRRHCAITVTGTRSGWSCCAGSCVRRCSASKAGGSRRRVNAADDQSSSSS